MTLQMRDNENKTLGEERKMVSLIRDLKESQIEMASIFLKSDVNTIKTILSLIKEHPEMDDEEIAELYIYQQD